jgi:hypothetical protein
MNRPFTKKRVMRTIRKGVRAAGLRRKAALGQAGVTEGQKERCSRLFAQHAGTILRCLSSLTRKNRYIAKIVIRNGTDR